MAVDLRRGSPTYGRWEAVELDDESMRELYVPVGFAHGFCVLSDVADVLYKQTAYYDPELERGIAWDDPEIAIEWPLPADELTVSERDAAAPRLSEIADELPFRVASLGRWHARPASGCASAPTATRSPRAVRALRLRRARRAHADRAHGRGRAPDRLGPRLPDVAEVLRQRLPAAEHATR